MPIQATASRGMLSTRTARRAHMTELTRVGLTCRASARAGSKGGSHDRAHTGAGSHAGHSARGGLFILFEDLFGRNQDIY